MAFVLTETLQLKKLRFLDGVMDSSGHDKDEDRFDADVALSTGLLSPMLGCLIEALGGELAWGATPPPSRPLAETETPDLALAGTDDPPF